MKKSTVGRWTGLVIAIIAGASMLSGCALFTPCAGTRVEALGNDAWATSRWICCPTAPVADAATKKLKRAADGTSWFGAEIANIWCYLCAQAKNKNEHFGEIVRVRWMTSALGVYDLYVNGVRIGDDFLKPGFTHVVKTRYGYTYDVTDLIRTDPMKTNTFLAEVSAGWWRDKIVGYHGQRSAFRGVIEYEFENGKTLRIGTQPGQWKSCVGGPVTHAGIFDGEEYDARIPLPELSQMKSSEESTEFDGDILPAGDADVSLRWDLAMTHGPLVLKKGETKVVDFGQNCAGVPQIRAKSRKGVVLTILPGEMLNDADKGQRGSDGPKGSLHRANLRMPEHGIRAVYTFGSDEWEEYMPRFTFFGYRYVSLTATDDVEFDFVRSIPVTSITREMETSSLETGDETLNRFISNVYWGQLSNYLSVPTDCPQRNERLGWSADTQVFCEAGAYNADTCAFFRKWMRDMRDSQDEEGGFPSVAPRAQYGNDTFKVGWADAGVIVPHTIWKMFGDRSIIEENWSAMSKFVRKLDATKYDFEGTHGHNYADWLSFETFETCGNQYGGWKKWAKHPDAMNYRRYLSACYWLYDARLMVEMAGALGREQDAKWFEQSADRALRYIREKFVETDGMLLKPMRHLQTACVFALKLGILDAQHAEKTKGILLESIANHGGCLQTGFLGTAWIMDALTVAGETKTAYSLLLNHNHPSWLYSVDQGATTVWERWNSYTKADGFGPASMNSFNHYAYGCVLSWIYRTAAGIAADPKTPGFRNIVMAPQPDRRLGHLTASYRSRAGVIKSAWRYEGKDWIWKFTVPDGATASVLLPGEKTPTTVGPGSYTRRLQLD